MNFIATSKNKVLSFNSDAHVAMFKDWLAKNEGKKIQISIAKNPVSDELRGYYFGCVIPFMKTLCKEWESLSNDELHEVLKKQFCFFEAWNSVTKRSERFGRPVMSSRSNTEKAGEFIENIRLYVSENYAQKLPDPNEYKSFINSAPTMDEEDNKSLK